MISGSKCRPSNEAGRSRRINGQAYQTRAAVLQHFRCRCFTRTGIAGVVEKADGVGLWFDSQLLNHMLDRFLAVGHLEGAIVFARGEFSLHEDMCAFGETWSDLREALPVSNNRVPLRFIFPFAFIVRQPCTQLFEALISEARIV